MKLDEIMNNIDWENFDEEIYKNVKAVKDKLSNKEKKDLRKIFANAKKSPKETVLLAIICYSIWYPDESIEEARKKGVFRYKIFGAKGKNNAKYYLQFLLKHAEVLQFSDDTTHYLREKSNCDWLEEFYQKTETKINVTIDEHHKKRIRKRVHGVNMESSLYKELLAYIDMLFFIGTKPSDKEKIDTLEAYSQEEIAEGVSYLLFKYIDRVGISEDKHYFVDAHFIQSDVMEKLILQACQINYMLEIELLVDFYDYDILNKENSILIRSRDDSLEKSIRLGYIKLEMQEQLFLSKKYENMENQSFLKQISDLSMSKLENQIVEKVKDGMLSRYRFSIPTPLLDKVAEQNVDGKISLYSEEFFEVQFFAKEMCMTPDELYERKVTEHCNVFDVLLCQRMFRFMFYIQKEIYDNEKDISIILQSLIPQMSKMDMLQFFRMFLKDHKKSEEIFKLFEYDSKYKFDIQYTPFVNIGKKVVYPMSVLAHSNLMRNTIAYSYLSNNKIVNDDGGLEPLVKVCKQYFIQCSYDYQVYSNLKYSYKGNKGEIDVLIVSGEEVIIIECKEPLMPTSNFEMRATFEHIEKASRQLDLAKKAFEDEGFRRKYFRDCLKLDGKRRTIRTCILLGNRLFSIWSGCKHPIRYIYELQMILNNGEIRAPFAKWSIWKKERYSHEDLVDYLSQNGLFIKLMQDSMEKYYNTMNFYGKKLSYEAYLLNIKKLFLLCDAKCRIIEKDERKWNDFLAKS